MSSKPLKDMVARLLKPRHLTVVGGGASVKDVDLKRLPGYVIAVNDSAVHLPRYDCAVTMDRKWIEYRWSFLHEKKKPLWARATIFQNLHDYQQQDWVYPFKNDNGSTGKLAEDWDALYGNNSGACAINLVYHLQPEHAWILGIDMGVSANAPYWYPPYPWAMYGATKPGHYLRWAKLLEVMIKQLRDRGIHVTVVTNNKWSKSVPLVTTQEFKELQKCVA